MSATQLTSLRIPESKLPSVLVSNPMKFMMVWAVDTTVPAILATVSHVPVQDGGIEEMIASTAVKTLLKSVERVLICL